MWDKKETGTRSVPETGVSPAYTPEPVKTTGASGPSRAANIGPSIQAKSARYVGLWRPNSLTITVFLSEPLGPNNSDVVGPFDLKLGDAGPPIRPCPIVY